MMGPGPMSAPASATPDQSSAHDRVGEPTLASTWQGVAGSPIGDELLEWPPDVFALTDVILERAEVYRFVLSPPEGGALAAGWRCGLGRRGRARSTTVECLG